MISLEIPPKLVVRGFTGVQRAQLSGKKVSGTFDSSPTEVMPTGRLIETFLNWPHDARGILRFTRTYGPLKQKFTAGETFEFNLSEFRDAQHAFQKMWQNLPEKLHLELQGGQLRFHAGVPPTYYAPTLHAYLDAELTTISNERVRVCKREKCEHPYFIARHLNQEFCSDQCAEEGKREWNKEWWQKHGRSWRAKRRKEISKQK